MKAFLLWTSVLLSNTLCFYWYFASVIHLKYHQICLSKVWYENLFFINSLVFIITALWLEFYTFCFKIIYSSNLSVLYKIKSSLYYRCIFVKYQKEIIDGLLFIEIFTGDIVYLFKCFPRTYPEKWLPNFDIKTALKTPLFSRSEQSVRNLLAFTPRK